MKFSLAALLALTLGMIMPAHAQPSKTVRVSTIPIMDVAPFMAARKLGYFEQEGLQVETASTAGGAVGIPALIGGAVDIAFSNAVSTLQAAGQGLDVRVIAPATNMVDNPAIPVLVGRKADAWKAPADFVGRTIGVNTRNGVNWLYARAWVKARGGDPDKVSFREVPFPQLADAIKRKQIDAGFAGEPFKSAFLKDPELAAVGSPFIEVQPGIDVGQYVTTGAYAAQNADTVNRFVRALRKGIVWFNENRSTPQVAELIAEYTRIPVATVSEIRLPPLPLTVNAAQIQRTAELMRGEGLLTAPVDTARLVLPVARTE